MNLHHILAAADESESGRQTARSSIDLAAIARSARLPDQVQALLMREALPGAVLTTPL